MITLIAAMSKGDVIGFEGSIPWGKNQRADIDHFRKATLDQTIILGSSTFAAEGFPLERRKHIVITREPKPDSENVIYMNFAEVLDYVQAHSVKNFYVIGGEAVFKLFMNYADILDLTFIDAEYKGDRFFPDIDRSVWTQKSKTCHEEDSDNLHPYCFVKYKKER